MGRIDVWGGVLLALVANRAEAAPSEERPGALPGVIDEPSEPVDPGEPPTDVTEPPSDAPGEPSDLATPEEPSEPPAGDGGEVAGEGRGGTEAPSDVAAPSEPASPPAGAGALTTPTPAPPPPVQTPSRATPAATPSSSPASASGSSAGRSTAADEGTGRGRERPAAEDEDEAKAKDEEDEEPIKHKGFIIDVRPGVLGCTGPICKNHGARPGFRLDGMIGRNFFGFVDLGLAGAWGTMGTKITPGTDGLSLYGIDPAALPPEAAVLMFDQFTVNDARLVTLQAGLDLRVHIIPRGRFDPYVGVGLQYTQLRGVYDTPGGSTRLGFHGLAFPLQAGFVVFATKRLALGAQLDWLWSWYGGITIRGAPGDFAAPIPAIKDAAAMAGVDLPGDLPNMWTVGAVVHLRLGKD